MQRIVGFIYTITRFLTYGDALECLTKFRLISVGENEGGEGGRERRGGEGRKGEKEEGEGGEREEGGREVGRVKREE